VCVDVTDGALVARELEVELADVVLETSDPANLLCVAIASFLFALANEFHKLLDEVSNLCHASTGECRVDHTNDGGGKGARVVVSPGPRIGGPAEAVGRREWFQWVGTLFVRSRRLPRWWGRGRDIGRSQQLRGEYRSKLSCLWLSSCNGLKSH